MSFSPSQVSLAQCASSSVALKLTARPRFVKVSPDHCVLYRGRRRLLYYLWYIIIIIVRYCKVTFYFTIIKVFKLIFLKVDENSNVKVINTYDIGRKANLLLCKSLFIRCNFRFVQFASMVHQRMLNVMLDLIT